MLCNADWDALQFNTAMVMIQGNAVPVKWRSFHEGGRIAMRLFP
jgi:hypothetical protein